MHFYNIDYTKETTFKTITAVIVLCFSNLLYLWRETIGHCESLFHPIMLIHEVIIFGNLSEQISPTLIVIIK